MADKKATRQAYGDALQEFGKQYDNLVVLDADLSKSTKTAGFKKDFPDRFFSTGIAEGNMMSTAAGIASCGKIVFASTFAIFAAGRAFEQVRNEIAYPKLNVKIGATHAGISVGEDGATHQAIEDIALMRAVPNMVVISPCDAVESRAAVKAAIEHDGPVYLRFGRLDVPIIFDENTYEFEIGKGIEMNDGSDLTIIANGLLVDEAMKAQKILADEGISARVINIHTIKPIDKDIILKAAKETGAIVTAEEHNIIGGLGSAVCEVISENNPVPVKRVGINDKFGTSGTPAQLLELYGLTYKEIVQASKEVIKLK